MNERILLFNPPSPHKSSYVIRDFYCSFSSKANYYWPPQDLLVLSGILRGTYGIEVLDAVASDLDQDACFEAVVKMPVSAIIFATGTASLHSDMLIMERIKKYKKVRVVGSSSIFRYGAAEIMCRYPFLDDLVSDFTDHSIIACLKGDYSAGGNLDYRQVEEVPAGKENTSNVFSCKTPLYEHFISMRNKIPLFGGKRFSVVVSSFGCRFNCAFCVAGTIKQKFRSVEEVLADIKYILGLGIKRIFFADPLFTADKKRVLEFCHAVACLGTQWICNAHASTICDAALLRAMKQAGCSAVMIGVESGNDSILKKYRKGTDTEQLMQTFRLCRESGIKTLAYFIVDLPGEDSHSVRNTIEFAKKIQCDYASFGYATPDIGTALRRESIEQGWFTESPNSEDADPSLAPVLETNKLSREEARGFLKSAYRSFYARPGYITKKLLEMRSPGDIKVLIKGGWSLLKKNIL